MVLATVAAVAAVGPSLAVFTKCAVAVAAWVAAGRVLLDRVGRFIVDRALVGGYVDNICWQRERPKVALWMYGQNFVEEWKGSARVRAKTVHWMSLGACLPSAI